MTAPLQIVEHTSDKYPPRTWANASAAGLTLAIADDFETPGERLTRRAAGERYLAVDLSMPVIDAARQLYRALRHFDAHTMNVAGNGIYTLHEKGWTQDQINLHLAQILGKVHQYWKIEKVFSGGQTGVDLAGIVAARFIGIPACATLPKGFIQRHLDKVDRSFTREQIEGQVQAGVQALRKHFGLDFPKTEGVTFFYGKKSPFSNFHEVDLEIEGQFYFCVEQYMMHQKAVLFGDTECADKILAATTPKECKEIGRSINDFDEATWRTHRENVVMAGCKAKFDQYFDLKNALLETEDTLLAEASPYDRIWGIGLSEADARKTDPQEWPGKNLLGRVLTRLREEYRAEMKLQETETKKRSFRMAA